MKLQRFDMMSGHIIAW